MFLGEGDPLTPNWAATADAARLTLEEASQRFPKIPSLPLSASNAEPLLAGLTGMLIATLFRGSDCLPCRAVGTELERRLECWVSHGPGSNTS